jgi:hypothetical protein
MTSTDPWRPFVCRPPDPHTAARVAGAAAAARPCELGGGARSCGYLACPARAHRGCLPCSHLLELELELIQSQMAQKPMLRGEVGARVRCAVWSETREEVSSSAVVQGARMSRCWCEVPRCSPAGELCNAPRDSGVLETVHDLFGGASVCWRPFIQPLARPGAWGISNACWRCLCCV